MQFFPASLQNLSDQFARLPGIGGKTAQRLAFHVLEMPLEEAQAFADAILEAKRTVHTCPCCQNLTDQPQKGLRNSAPMLPYQYLSEKAACLQSEFSNLSPELWTFW